MALGLEPSITGVRVPLGRFFYGYEDKEAESPTCHVGTLAGASPVITATLPTRSSVQLEQDAYTIEVGGAKPSAWTILLYRGE